MARATYNLDYAYMESGVVVAGQTVRQGMPVIDSGAGTIQEGIAQANVVLGIAYSMEDQAPVAGAAAWTAVAGTRVNYVRLGSPCVVPCRVGAAGCTLNNDAICAAAGGVNYALAAGANVTTCIGKWTETGLVNDLRGLYVGAAYRCLGA